MSNEPHDPPYGGEQQQPQYGYETPLPYGEQAPYGEQVPYEQQHLHPHVMPAAPGDGYAAGGSQDPYAAAPEPHADSGSYVVGLEGQPGWDTGSAQTPGAAEAAGPEAHVAPGAPETAYLSPVPEQGGPQPSESAGYAPEGFAETAYLPPASADDAAAQHRQQADAVAADPFAGSTYPPQQDTAAAQPHQRLDASSSSAEPPYQPQLPPQDSSAAAQQPTGPTAPALFGPAQPGTDRLGADPFAGDPLGTDSPGRDQLGADPLPADPLGADSPGRDQLGADSLGADSPAWPAGWERPAQLGDGPQTEIGASLPDAPGSAPTGRRRRVPGGEQAAEDAVETAYLPPVTADAPAAAPTGRRRRPSPDGQPAPGPSPTGQSPHGQPSHGQSPHGQPPAGPSPHGQPPHGQSPHGQSPHGQPSHGQSPAGQSPAGQSPHGQSPHGQSPLGQPRHNQPPTGPSPHSHPAAAPDMAETAYLPPITDDAPAADVAATAYLPPITDDTPPPGRAATPPPGHPGAPTGAGPGHPGAPAGAGPGHPGAPTGTRPGHPAAPASPGSPGAPGAPGGPLPNDEMGPPTLHGAPTRRRPAPPPAELRAEGSSPVISPGGQPAAITAGIGLLLLLAAAFDTRPGLAGVVAALQVVTAAGWFRLNGMWPARQGIALAAAGGITATAAMLAFERAQGPAVALGALGAWSLVIIIVQLRNTTPSDDRLNSLTATVGATLFAVLASGYLAAEPDAVITGATAVAIAALVRAIPLPPVAGPVVAALAAAAAGFAAGELTDLGSGGALLGLAAGCSALIGLRTASYDFPSRFVHMTAGVTLPLALATPAIYLLGRALA